MPTHKELPLDRRERRIAGALVASLLVPFAGFVLGITYLLRERVGRGLALVLVGFVCFAGWGLVASAALVAGADHAITESEKRLKARAAKGFQPRQSHRAGSDRSSKRVLTFRPHMTSAERAEDLRVLEAEQERTLERFAASTRSKSMKAAVRRQLEQLRAKIARALRE